MTDFEAPKLSGGHSIKLDSRIMSAATETALFASDFSFRSYIIGEFASILSALN